MIANRLSVGTLISGGSAILLIVSMFFDWFGVKASDDSLRLFDIGHSVWEAFDYVPIVLLITSLVTVVAVVIRVMTVKRAPGVWFNVAAGIFGGASALLILVRVVDPPDFGSEPTSFETVIFEGTVRWPIIVGLIGAAGIAYGSYRMVREEGVSPTGLDGRRIDER